ncbi:MAG: type III pantothenate kinase [Ignavibacteriales bacterium]|nr:type III pantothenate kinase [Ignavibacteriales bacterium]
MILTCDIGNSRIKFGSFIGDELIDFRAYHKIEDSIKFILEVQPAVIAISSVASFKLNQLINAVKPKFLSNIFFVDRHQHFNLIINYNSAATLGIDRICSAEGAIYLLQKDKHLNQIFENDFIMTIDFGTATTINLVKFPNVFEGGLIMPGMKLMSESLYKRTEQLPEIKIAITNSVIGKTTEENINSGIINSTVGLIERVIRKIKDEFKADVKKIFITGGNAKLVQDNLDFEYEYSEGLVLYGIKSIYDLNLKKN